ncbi:DUF2306 domain-containing protein [Aquipuribacter sp. SD81]|uniref:DUF2306 domain-containing protein n=1 Tax=Aquipuribacter sp. SD81 TaxID=3127703 RepID=UPI00301A6D8F
MTAPLVLVAVHAATAVLCVGLGGYALLRRRKGDAVHRLVGWSWVAGMTFVATSSFAIRDLRDGRLSVLHVLSVVTLVALVLGVRAARRHDRQAHRGNMLGSYLGLLGAFAGAVAVPDRLVPTFVVTRPLEAVAAVLVLVACWVVVVGGAHAWARTTDRRRRALGPRRARAAVALPAGR